MIGLLVSLWLAGPPALIAQDAPIRVVRKDVEITVFSEAETKGETLYQPVARPQQQRAMPSVQPGPRQSLNMQRWGGQFVPPSAGKTGMALVKDHRLVLNLKRGDNVVRFTDVAATIDPTSVRLVSDTAPLGLRVVEQNFEYDLADADALLKRYLERPIACIDKDGGLTEGHLVSYDNASIVLADAPPDKATKPKTQALARATLRAVRLADVPDDLHTKPTLVWTLRTDHPGRHDMTLSYLCGKVKWRADYVVGIEDGPRDEGDRLLVKGWVTIENQSGSTYADAGVKLIAGDVNRVPDPWAAVQKGVVVGGAELQVEIVDGALDLYSSVSSVKEFVEKAFFEYHLYTLSAPSTVRDRQIKQLNLLRAEDVTAKRRYVYDATQNEARPRVELVVKNEEDNHLGMPLPKGRVTFMQRDADDELHFVGRDEIDHTSADEELELKRGYAFDVTGERIVVDTKRGRAIPILRKSQLVETIRVRVRNHKDEPITVRCVEHLQHHPNWRITKTTDEWLKHDVNTIHFDFALEANQEKAIVYTVDYTW